MSFAPELAQSSPALFWSKYLIMIASANNIIWVVTLTNSMERSVNKLFYMLIVHFPASVNVYICKRVRVFS